MSANTLGEVLLWLIGIAIGIVILVYILRWLYRRSTKETAFVRSMKTQVPWMTRESLALRTDSDLASLALLRAGFGITACQVGLARRDPNLVRLFPKQITLGLDTWLAMHEDLRDSPSCRATFAALTEGLTRYVDSARANS